MSCCCFSPPTLQEATRDEKSVRSAAVVPAPVLVVSMSYKRGRLILLLLLRLLLQSLQRKRAREGEQREDRGEVIISCRFIARWKQLKILAAQIEASGEVSFRRRNEGSQMTHRRFHFQKQFFISCYSRLDTDFFPKSRQNTKLVGIFL
jgi:hypothetical protein